MELDVLSVDNPRTSPIGHRQPITSSPFGVGSMAVDAPQASGGEDSYPSQVTVDSEVGLVKNINPVAVDRLIDSQRIAGVVRECDQVHRGG